MVLNQPIVNKIKCRGCEACVQDCPEDVFEMRRGKSKVISNHLCTGCQACIKACELGAIRIQEFDLKGE